MEQRFSNLSLRSLTYKISNVYYGEKHLTNYSNATIVYDNVYLNTDQHVTRQLFAAH